MPELPQLPVLALLVRTIVEGVKGVLSAAALTEGRIKANHESGPTGATVHLPSRVASLCATSPLIGLQKHFGNRAVGCHLFCAVAYQAERPAAVRGHPTLI